MQTQQKKLLIPIFALACAALFAGEEKPAEPKTAKEESFVVERADLQPVIEMEGTIDPGAKRVLRVLPEEFPGPYSVLEALPSGRKVEAGAVVMRLDTAGLERTLRAAREGLDSMKKKYETLQEDYATLLTSNRLKLERMNLELTNVQKDLKSFEKYGEEQMLKSKELAVKGQEFQVAEREDELAQLEKMYKDTQLATNTKEIVLERARRSAAISRQWLDLTKKGEKQLLEIDHPVRKEMLGLIVEQKKQDLELLKISTRLAESAKTEEVAAQQRWVRDNSERLGRLEADLALLSVKAPIAGIVVNHGVNVGDKAASNVALGEVWDLTHFNVKFLASASELVDLKAGDKVSVRLKDFPGEELEAKIEDIAVLPTPEGQDKGGVKYAVRAKVSDNKFLRPGLKGRVELKHEKLKKAITLPRSAVIYKDDRAWCKVRAGDKIETREIVLGFGDRERVSVEKGLSEGDVVVTKEGAK